MCVTVHLHHACYAHEFGHDTHVVPWAALPPVADFNTVLPTLVKSLTIPIRILVAPCLFYDLLNHNLQFYALRLPDVMTFAR
ncbi:hypothetical protein DL765_010123 [Monosporascus sp. GIB2]|nr:hypothetical protein DL765_010123 [Monosporascus sp. GIB2]